MSRARAGHQCVLYWSAVGGSLGQKVEVKTLFLLSFFLVIIFFVLNLSLRCEILRSEEVKTLLQTETLNATL